MLYVTSSDTLSVLELEREKESEFETHNRLQVVFMDKFDRAQHL